jgi:hypothetical protein
MVGADMCSCVHCHRGRGVALFLMGDKMHFLIDLAVIVGWTFAVYVAAHFY